jgi:enoyl-CoA hydratase/carnithine racemase
VTKSPDGITTITINRPAVRNCVNHATSLELASAFLNFDADPSQKVCILTGAGANFCSGYDLREVAGAAGPGEELHVAEPVDKLNGAKGPMGPSRMSLSKPVIAAVSGYAVAGGLELSLLADMRVVDKSAVFGVFCRRFGVPLIDGGTIRLTKVIGLGRAMDMVLTGRPVGADEALSFGLANRVVETGKALDAALELARDMARFPQQCLRADLSSMHHAAYDTTSLEDALRYEFSGGSKVIQEESVEGAAKFTNGVGRSGSFNAKI